jgi:hypothetical protein
MARAGRGMWAAHPDLQDLGLAQRLPPINSCSGQDVKDKTIATTPPGPPCPSLRAGVLSDEEAAADVSSLT